MLQSCQRRALNCTHPMLARLLLLSCLLPLAVSFAPSRTPRLKLASVLRGGAIFASEEPSDNLKADRLMQPSLTQLDASIDRAVALTAEKEVILQFKPSSRWLFKQWKGTVLLVSWKMMLFYAAVSAFTSYVIRFGMLGTAAATWPLFTPPVATHPVISRMTCLTVMWELIAGLATFILTFFVGQAYGYWREQLGLCRALQGRLHDINFMASTFAARDEEVSVVLNCLESTTLEPALPKCVAIPPQAAWPLRLRRRFTHRPAPLAGQLHACGAQAAGRHRAQRPPPPHSLLGGD